MQRYDDEGQDFFNTFSESLPVLIFGVVVAMTVGVACFCGLAIVKAALSPFARVARWRPTSSFAQSSDGLYVLPFASQHAFGETQKAAAFSGDAEEPATMRRAA